MKLIFILNDDNLNYYYNNNKHTINYIIVITLIIAMKQQTQLILHNLILININHYYNNYKKLILYNFILINLKKYMYIDEKFQERGLKPLLAPSRFVPDDELQHFESCDTWMDWSKCVILYHQCD